jgi:hypothetical protein
MSDLQWQRWLIDRTANKIKKRHPEINVIRASKQKRVPPLTLIIIPSSLNHHCWTVHTARK